MKFYNEKPRALAVPAPEVMEQACRKKAYLWSTVSKWKEHPWRSELR
jgi:hypothetical protein